MTRVVVPLAWQPPHALRACRRRQRHARDAAILFLAIRHGTWITRPGFHVHFGRPEDSLVVAIQIGSRPRSAPAGRGTQSAFAGWPAAILPTRNYRTSLAIITNTVAIAIPRLIEDSQVNRVLWDNIAAELHDDPVAVEDPNRYLDDPRGENCPSRPMPLDQPAVHRSVDSARV